MSKIGWEQLTNISQMRDIHNSSATGPVIIFKYSNRCGISDMALSRLDRQWEMDKMSHVVPYFLDLITYREISDRIAEIYQVRHESPQLLLIKDGQLQYHTSHMGISYSNLKNHIP